MAPSFGLKVKLTIAYPGHPSECRCHDISLIESCEVQDHHDRFQSTSGVTQNMPFWGIPFTVLKTHIYIGLF